jgi:hypothetical protein
MRRIGSLVTETLEAVAFCIALVFGLRRAQ